MDRPGGILVAGGTGLVGANLALRLEQLGAEVTATRHGSRRPEFARFPQYDFRNFDACLDATRGKAAVVVCAALSHGAAENRANPTGSILPNAQIAGGLLEASARNGVGTVVLLSSSTVYQPADYPIAEADLDLNQLPHASYLGAGTLNRFLEQLAVVYATTRNLRVAVLRPTSVYGPYDNFSDEKSHVLPALIKRALAGEAPYVVWGGPEVVRDFVYVDDVVQTILRVLEDVSSPAPRPVNVCSGAPVTIGQLVPLILQACGHDAPIHFDTAKPTTIPYRAVSDALFVDRFPGLMRMPLGEGIRRTVDWYRAQTAKRTIF